jgi:hypothetical protein
LSEAKEEVEARERSPAPARREWSAAALLIEIFSIVLGVLLALGLSEWSEERQHQAQADIALANVVLEITSNKALLGIIHENNTATIAAMNNPSSADDVDRNIIPGLQLQETAWQAFLSTGLSNYADYNDVLELSQLYSIQDIYKQTGAQIVEATMQMSAFAVVQETEVDNDQFQEKFQSYFEMLSTIEAELLLSYDKAVAKLNTADE